jgi:hypothetical protein
MQSKTGDGKMEEDQEKALKLMAGENYKKAPRDAVA